MTRINRFKLLVGIMMTANGVYAASAIEPEAKASEAANLFALDLYGQIRESKGNICISPYSLSSALNMVACGAAGTTANQMYQALHWTDSPGDLPAASARLSSSMQQQTGDPTQSQNQISIANALFGQQGFPFRKDFLDLLNNQYNATLQQVDFAGAPAKASDQVNQWAANKTNDRIKQALDPGQINGGTRLILVDAVYFKANWEDAFSKSATESKPFTTENSEPIAVPMMQQTHSFNYVSDDTLQIAALPYMGNFEMDIILPRSKDGITAVEKSLTADRLNGLFEKLAPQLLDLSLPKFKMDGKYELRNNLQQLGMKDAFDSQTANFSGITSSDKLNIDNVFQKTFISLDEDGTEAAAVTGITMRSMAMRARTVPEKVIFMADHPFLFIIRHRPTGTILFMGRMTNPK